jgi:GNAT superfamily N-acetyltransferase
LLFPSSTEETNKLNDKTMMDAETAVFSLKSRPDFVSIVAQWLWSEFWRYNGVGLDQTLAKAVEATQAEHMPRIFVLTVDGEPVGMASLVISDLSSRPDLSPWLAGVYVVPRMRRRGLVLHLVKAVEAEAAAQGYDALWLFTRTAEHIYARGGWITTEMFERKGRDYALMRRDLPA